MDLDTGLGILSFIMAFIMFLNKKLRVLSILFICYVIWFSEIMFYHESFAFAASCFFGAKFLHQWYKGIAGVWPKQRTTTARVVLGTLPIISTILMLVVLVTIASYDVNENMLFIIMYLMMHFAWLYATFNLLAVLFNLHWLHDVFVLNNVSAMIATSGVFIGSTIIFAFANIGDGPGWWTVIVAGAMGLLLWIILGAISEWFGDTFERITIDRDIACAIRFTGYLLGSSLILGRASSGDWRSLYDTVLEFISACWPVFILAAVMLGIEIFYKYRNMKRLEEDPNTNGQLVLSTIIGVAYVAYGFYALQLSCYTKVVTAKQK